MKHNTVTQVTVSFIKRIGTAALWYLSIFVVVIVILQIIFMLTGVDTNALIEVDDYSFTPFLTYVFTDIFVLSYRIFLLILGMIYPLLFFRYYLEAGVTRRQFALGVSAAAIALSLCFAVLSAVITLFIGTFSTIGLLSGMAYSIIYFFIGWVGAIGFPLRRFYTAALGIASAEVLFWGTIVLARLSIVEWIKPLIVLVAAGLVMAMLLKAFRRVT